MSASPLGIGRLAVLGVAVGVAAVGMPGTALGQAAAPDFERLDSGTGLSHNSVYSILQDSKGFLWFGTVDGLNRYDGYEFVVHRHAPGDPTSISNSVINALLEDRSGSIWVGTEAGLNRVEPDGEGFRRVPLLDGSGGDLTASVHTLYEDRDGRVWAGTTAGLFRVDALEAVPVPVGTHTWNDDELRTGGIVGIQQDRRGDLWLLSTDGASRGTLHRLAGEGGLYEELRLADGWAVPHTLLIDSGDRVWIDASGPAGLDRDRGRVLRTAEPRVASAAWAILEAADGTVWVGSSGEGIYSFAPEASGRVSARVDPTATDYLRNYVRSVYEDRSGALWIGTQGGLYRRDPHRKPFARVAHDPARPGSISSDAVSALMEGPGGDLWVGTFGGGLNRVDRDTGVATHYRHRAGDRNSLRNDIVWALHGDGDRGLWVGTSGGLCLYERSTDGFAWHDLDVGDQAAASSRLTDIAVDADGVLWLTSHRGLFRYDPARRAARLYAATGDTSGPSSNALETIFLDPSGILWIGTGTQSLDRFDPDAGTFRHYALSTSGGTALRSEGVWDIVPGEGGELWLGTGTGLSSFDPRRERFEHYFETDGLPGSIVYSILHDDEERFWLGTNLGLSRFDHRPVGGLAFRNYDLADGIGSTEFNRGAALRSSDGRLYFGGMDGITYFSPDEIRDNPYAPPVVLTRVVVSNRDGTTVRVPGAGRELTLSYREYSLSFEFAALSYTNPAQNRYAYMLDGFDEAWVDAGTRRFASYTNIPPGGYVFRVRGSNNDGLWNEQGLALPIRITPPFWQTLWFRTLAVLAVAAAATAAYRYRVARLLEMERLRVRIASDLHDDLSSELSGIAVATDVVGSRAPLDEVDRERLVDVRDTALGMADGLRDIVWYITPEHDNLEATIRRMRAVADRLLADREYRFEAPSPVPRMAIDMASRRQVFLIYKEVLHNVARHSGADSVAIRIEHRRDRLELRVRDDGVGFDTDNGARGQGLASIRRRAEQIGARLSIESRPGEGTSLRLIVRIPRTRDSRPVIAS